VTTTSDSKTEPEKEKKYLLVYLVGQKNSSRGNLGFVAGEYI